MRRTRNTSSPTKPALPAVLAWLVGPGVVFAQDLEPRRWSHLPVGTNVTSLTYIYTDGDVKLDPVLQIENGEVEAHTLVWGYSHWFDFYGKTGRVDVLLPYSTARWEGLLSGALASRRRRGFADPWIRLSINLAGAPALKGKEFQQYRAAHPVSTVVGAALGVMLPIGDYQDDKLLNLGQNRFVIRPQAGVVHIRGAWSYELTGSVFFFTENDDFFQGSTREQDPLYEVQAHVVHTFPSRWWASASAGYNWGGASEIDGVGKDDERGDLLSALSVGLPVGKAQGLKLVYLHGETLENVGTDTNSFLLSWNVRF